MNRETKIVIIAAIIAFAMSIPFIIHDAIHKEGSFMTTATYREYVREGKGIK